MVIIENQVVQSIPVLHVVKENLKGTKTPFIMFVHGFESAKEHNLHYAYLLAEKGFRVVLPEANYHGEREENLSQSDRMFRFWNVIIQTIHELNIIKNHFVESEQVDDKNIGVVGTSMGGIVTLGALTQYDWIKAAISLMGSPHYADFAKAQINHFRSTGVNIPFTDDELEAQYKDLEPYDLSKNAHKLKNRPLMFWHGKRDQMVPYEPTFNFYKKLKNMYTDNPDKLFFLTDEKAGHKVSREGLLKTVEWFEKWLINKDVR
ncbi:prolyl oligopeptidase family serine peptidase [Heyndrickxia sp. NPDC080065]|uniref:prolyl oligopeptidase family serine peptidase n=1 Tax=Heyndrickxia sp. NPDC080065 TaxID=3390568 RepID=UPI003D005D74